MKILDCLIVQAVLREQNAGGQSESEVASQPVKIFRGQKGASDLWAYFDKVVADVNKQEAETSGDSDA